MTQNLRSTYTWQGTQKQEPIEDLNKLNNYNAISYYYPYASPDTLTKYPEYGLLYTWGAANIGTLSTEATNAFPNATSTRQGICPEGWVVPSDYDINQLEKEIATNPSLYSSQTTPVDGGWKESYEGMTGYRPSEGNTNQTYWGRQMKSITAVTGTTNDGSSNSDGTGFNALLVGCLDGGSAILYGTYTDFWSSSAGNATVAWRRDLNSGRFGASRLTNNKYYSFSVRCKKL
jgi:uncharacterized protein (TIGR02145 family)